MTGLAEELRVARVRSLGVLDDDPEPQLDDAARLAAFICRAPISLVTFVTDDRQQHKARVGTNLARLPLEESFCRHSIGSTHPLVVEDAVADPRFAHNSLVVSDPHVRFYAGTPLNTADGHTLGSLCVLDHQPRRLDEAQLEALQALGRQVVAHLERRVALRELAMRNDQLYRRDDHRSRVVANVSHELRTPLSSVLGYSELLLEGRAGQLDDPALELVGIIHRSGERLERIVGDLVRAHQVEDDAASAPAAEVSLEQVAREVVQELAEHARGAGVEVVVRSEDEGSLVRGDHDRLVQVATNLVGNAIKFSPGGSTVTVLVGAHRDRGVLCVRDEGPGLSTEDQARVFDRYWRSPTAERDAVPGTGLGLAIARDIVADHGGDLYVGSEPGHGATFCVEIPLA